MIERWLILDAVPDTWRWKFKKINVSKEINDIGKAEAFVADYKPSWRQSR